MRNMKARSRSKKSCRARGFGYDITKKHQIMLEDRISYCPYCNSRMELRNADEIYKSKTANNDKLYVCSSYPECNTYVRTRKEGNLYLPVAIPGDDNLRALRTEAHYYFDKLTQTGIFPSRTDAYLWLADKLQLKTCHAHIGSFSESLCIETIKCSVDVLLKNKNKSAGLVKPYLNREHQTYTMKDEVLLEKLSKLVGRVIYVEQPTKAACQ